MLRISTTLCILFTAALAHSAVIVEQIEAPELGNFSPVSNPFGIATDPTFPGKTFIALDSASAGQSEHADAVAQDFYGPSSVAATAVSKVYADDANHFISTQLLTQKSTGSAPAPQPLPPGLSVANLSFVATLGSRSSDLDAIRRLDTVAAKNNIIIVAGAVSETTGQFAGDDLFWSSRNALAIRGTDPATPFVPAAAKLGRTHADLWSDNDSSFATARVSGYAAALIDHARAKHQTAAAHDYTIRSLLMTGADPTASAGTVTPLRFTTPNHLDPDSGAGKADFAASLSILDAGQLATLPVTTNSIKPAKIPTRTEGFASLSLKAKSLTAIVFQSPTPISTLIATLSWDVSSALHGSKINTSDKSTPIADLSLDVRQVKKIPGKGYQLGAPLKKLGLVSDAKNDNVEHLSFDGNLPAGTYAFIVRGDNSLTSPAGFSYRIESTATPAARPAPPSISIPEPSSILLMTAASAAITLARRRTQPA